MTPTDKQQALADRAPADYSDLRALFVNCTLKRSPEVSNTDGDTASEFEIHLRGLITLTAPDLIL